MKGKNGKAQNFRLSFALLSIALTLITLICPQVSESQSSGQATTPSSTAKKEIKFNLLVRDGAGELVSAANLEVLTRVLSPNSCILKEENFKNISISEGVLSLQVGGGTATNHDPGLSLKQIYDNRTPRNSLTCLDTHQNLSAGNYSPSENDSRTYVLSFPYQNQTLTFDFPLNMEDSGLGAEYINGKGVNDLIGINEEKNVTQANLEALLNAFTNQIDSATMAALASIQNGNYAGNAASATSAITATTAQKAGAFANAPTGCSSGQYAVGMDTRGNLQCATPGAGIGGSVTSLTAGTGLTGSPGGTITTTGTLAVDVGVTDGKILQVQTGNRLPAVDASLLTGFQADQIPTLTTSNLSDFTTQVNSLSEAVADGRITNYMSLHKGVANGLANLNGSTNPPPFIPPALLPNSLYQALLKAQQIQIANSITGTPSTVTFKAPDSGNYTLEMPGSVGVTGQILSLAYVTGSGTLGTLGWTALSTSSLPVVPIQKGGTGLTAPGGANQILGVDGTGSNLEYKSLTQGSGVSISHGPSSVVLSATGSGGTVTSVSASLPLTVANSTTTYSISLTGGSDTGQTLRWDQTGQTWQTNKIHYQDIVNSISGTSHPWPVDTCETGQFLDYNVFTDLFSCKTVGTSTISGSISFSQVSDLGALASQGSVDLSTNAATGVLPVAKGGTGLTIPVAPDQIAAINSSGNFTYKTLVAGSGVNISDSANSISITASGSGGIATNVSATAPISVADGTSAPVISLFAGGVGSGETLRWNAGNSTWENNKLVYTDVINSLGASPWPAEGPGGNCGAGQAIVWNSVSDAFVCTALVASAITGQIPLSQVDDFGDLAGLSILDLSSLTVAQGILDTDRLPAFTGDVTSTVGTNILSLSSPLAANKGGTGLTNPGPSGYVLTSSGSGWISAPLPTPAATMTVQNITEANHTITTSDSNTFYEVSTTGGATLTLPNSASAASGFSVIIKNTSSSPVTITTPDSSTLDGATSYVLATSYSGVTVYNTASKWYFTSLHLTEAPAKLISTPQILSGVDALAPADGSCNNFQVTNLGQATTSSLTLTLPTGFSNTGCTNTCSGSGQTLTGGATCTVGIKSLASNDIGPVSGSLVVQATGSSATTFLVGRVSDICEVTTPAIGTVCAKGAIYAGTFDGGKYMVMPSGCSDIPDPDYGRVGSGPASYTLSDFPVTCGGTDTLVKTWNDGTGAFSGSDYDIPGVENNTVDLSTKSTVRGDVNQAAIVSITIPAGGGYHAAARYCDKLSYGGYTDWYLPSKSELAYLYCKSQPAGTHNAGYPSEDPNCSTYGGKSSSITGFANGWYWSSTEYLVGGYGSTLQSFSNGEQGWGFKYSAYYLRCMRRF